MTLFISRPSAPQAIDKTSITTLDIRNSVLTGLESYTCSKIIIASTDEHAYEDAKIACQFKVKLLLNDTTFTTSTMKQFEKALFLFELANTMSECHSAEQSLINSLIQVVPFVVREEQALELIKQASNSNYKTNTENNFKKALQVEKDGVKSIISVSESNEHVTFVDIPYGEELANHLVNLHNSDEDTLNMLTGFLAGGKSKTIIEAFNKFCEQGKTPIAAGCSRALMSSFLHKGDPRFYLNALKSREMPKGLLGVVNTILLNEDFAKVRLASEIFMVDEIEEVLNHMSGAAVGEGKLDDQMRIYSRFEEQVKKSKTVILADAFTSEFTMEYLVNLAKESGKKIFVYRQEATKKKPVVRVMSEEMNISAARNNLKNNKKIAVFCDGSHNKTKSAFNALYLAIKPTNGFSIKIDAAFMQSKSTSHRLSNADALADDMVALFYNSAAKCGLSIQNGEYKNTHVFGNKTVAPNELVQAPGRPRDTENMFLSFSQVNRRLPPQTQWAILGEIMSKECTPEDFTQEKQSTLFKDALVKKILARIEHKNKMKKNYQNKVLMMLEILGYEIKYIINDDQASVGRQNKKRGSEVERALHKNGVISAQKISKNKASELRACGDFNSQIRKNELESFYIRAFYKVDDVTEDLHKFDNEAKGRKVITNMMIARGETECKIIDAQIKQNMIAKFFQITGLDAVNFGKYNRINANQFQYFLNTGEIKVGEKTISAKDAFKKSFPNSNITSRAMSTVSSVLIKSFMLATPKKHDREGNKAEWNYLAIPNEKVEARYERIVSYNKKNELVKVETPCNAPVPEIEPMKPLSNIKPQKEVQEMQLELTEMGSIEELLRLSEAA
ncbi:MAG: hypothetical protein ACJAS1_005146 [Oleiphilaceae bacterium]|jgi:hypothetical protein